MRIRCNACPVRTIRCSSGWADPLSSMPGTWVYNHHDLGGASFRVSLRLRSPDNDAEAAPWSLDLGAHSRTVVDHCSLRCAKPLQVAIISSAPGRIRTSDTWFRKPLLYPLSYEGGMQRG
jgi:hypothetical protein